MRIKVSVTQGLLSKDADDNVHFTCAVSQVLEPDQNGLIREGKEVTISGVHPNVNVGDEFIVRGNPIDHDGVVSVIADSISSPDFCRAHTLAYLKARIKDHVSTPVIQYLYDLYEEDTIHQLITKPQDIAINNDIHPTTMNHIADLLKKDSLFRESFNYLTNLGIDDSKRDSVLEFFGEKAHGVVSGSPYRLTEVKGFNIKNIDPIAKKLGFSESSRLRLHAAFNTALERESGSGNTLFPVNSLAGRISRGAQISYEDVQRFIQEEKIEKKQVRQRKMEDGRLAICLKEDFVREQEIGQRLAKLQFSPFPQKNTHFNFDGVKLDDTQKGGVVRCAESKISILTGGPGTGKTTVLDQVLESLRPEVNAGRKILCSAPTGKAVGRIKEQIQSRLDEGIISQIGTIHALLKYTPETGFQHNENNPLDVDTFVIDEHSMVDTELFLSLLRALPQHCRLIMLGDIDQLPSVGPGQVLKDLIDSKMIEYTKLEKCYRLDENGRAIRNARAIINGQDDKVIDYGINDKGDYHFVHTPDDTENIIQEIKRLLLNTLPEKGIDLKNTQVLAPMLSKGPGVYKLNEALKPIFNPSSLRSKDFIKKFSNTFHVGDRVMQTQNNSKLGIFNGDIGHITEINKARKSVSVQFDDKNITISYKELNDLTLAYAMTTHKSQGSEFEAVIMPISSSHANMNTPNLVYTGITRGKKQVFMVGSRAALKDAIENTKNRVRTTSLKDSIVHFFGVMARRLETQYQHAV
ncbi:AAA family ATPase [Neptuniibacter sp. QD37_11]|uniref:SF1B family DNA helicase RecD2 n=1 Tax=Neptuniibacter sp. QD37_11 TaxID=3398209 RepID=UPI0039F621CF